MMLIQHHAAGELYRRAKDQFDRLYAEGARQPRVMAIAVHPYISGVPTGSSTSRPRMTTSESRRASGSRRARRSPSGTGVRGSGGRRPAARLLDQRPQARRRQGQLADANAEPARARR